MGPEPLRAAVVGCGRIGTSTRPELVAELPPGWLPLNHADAIRAVPGLTLEAFCDTNPESLERAKTAFGVARGYLDYRALIQELHPDILSIATRTAGRCDMIEYACRHGVRGIHLEKPISTNLADCDRALGAASAAGVKLSYGTTRRFMEIYERARELLQAGEIGSLIEIQVQMGRALLLWNQPHAVDLLIYYSGTREVEFVQARGAPKSGPWGPDLIDDDPAVEYALVRFKNGVTGSISSAGGYNVLLCGTDGMLLVGGNGGRLELRKKRSPEDLYFQDVKEIGVTPPRSGTASAFYRLETAVRQGHPSPFPAEDIAAGQQVLLAIALSALQAGRAVSPAEVRPGFTVTGRYGQAFA